MPLGTLQVVAFICTILLIFLCWRDFYAEFKPYLQPQFFRFIFAFILFSTLNLILYSSICWFLIGVDLYSLYYSPPSNFVIEPYMVIQPIVIAGLYFGAGSAKIIKISGRQISIYSMIFRLTGNLFSPFIPDPLAVRRSLEHQEQYKILLQGIKKVRANIAPAKGWDLLKEKWDEMDLTQLEHEIEVLNNIQKQIEDKKWRGTIASYVTDENEQINTLMLARLRQYAQEFIEKNVKTLDDLRTIADCFELDNLRLPKPASLQIILNTAWFAAIAGVMSGLVIGLTKGEHIFLYPWIGFVAFLAFGLIFSIVTEKARRIDEATLRCGLYLLAGFVAGLLGNGAWRFLTGLIAPGDFGEVSWESGKLLIVGAIFGISIGGVYWIGIEKIANREWKHVYKYVAMTLIAALLFVVLSMLFGTFELGGLVRSAVSGALIMLALTYSSKMFVGTPAKRPGGASTSVGSIASKLHAFVVPAQRKPSGQRARKGKISTTRPRHDVPGSRV